MIIDDLHIFRPGSGPAEADAELVVDADAVLSSAIALERFEAVAGGHSKVFQPPGDLQLPELPPRDRLDLREAPDPSTVCQGLGVGASKRYDHFLIVSRRVTIVKRAG